jgi:hypothetical protein
MRGEERRGEDRRAEERREYRLDEEQRSSLTRHLTQFLSFLFVLFFFPLL